MSDRLILSGHIVVGEDILIAYRFDRLQNSVKAAHQYLSTFTHSSIGDASIAAAIASNELFEFWFVYPTAHSLA